MSRILFLCNTYYQLIVALQCKNTLFNKDHVDVILSDHSLNANVIVERMKKSRVFDGAYYLETRAKDQGHHSVIQVLRGLGSTVFGTNLDLKKILMDNVYDEFVYYNLSVSSLEVYAFIQKNNKDVICSRMEEGIVGYKYMYNEKGDWHFSKQIELAFMIRKILMRDRLVDNCHNYYCFFPAFYNGNFTAYQIPLIKDNDLIHDQLAMIFDINESMRIKEKYIFFTSVYDFEGDSPIGEFEVVNKVADIVGKNNLMIKMHPRDRRNIFQKSGIRVLTNSSIPWEALQLYFNYYDKVLLTATSGAVLSVNLMVENPIRSYFLFNKCDIKSNHLAVNTVNTLTDIFESKLLKDRINGVKVVQYYEEILE